MRHDGLQHLVTNNAQHLVTLDSGTFHKSLETAQLIAATGAMLLFLPPYSPDVNPVEHDLATLKKTPGMSWYRLPR